MFFQMFSRVHGHLLGNGVVGTERAGELGVWREVLRAHTTAASRIVASRGGARLLHRQAVHATNAVHWHLFLHQRQ